MAYDTAAFADEDAAALKSRQAELRELGEEIAEFVMAQPLPETWLEAVRAVRSITTSDRFLQRVPPVSPSCAAGGGTIERSEDGGRVDSDDDDDDDDNTPVSPVRDPYRLRLRVHADKVMAAALDIPKPVSFLEAERAARYAENANIMLLQLYTPRKAPRPAFDDFDEEEDGEDAAGPGSPRAGREWMEKVMARLDDVTCHYARRYGFWPTGATYDEGRGDPKAHIYEYVAKPEGVEIPETLDDDALPEFIVHRVNCMAYYRARHHGHWPDGRPFNLSDPPYVYVSANFGTDVRRPAPDEISEGGPWWIVRKRRDPDAGPEPPD